MIPGREKVPKKKDKYREVLERRLELLCYSFYLFHQNDYKEIKNFTLKQHLKRCVKKVVKETMEDFFESGKASFPFYCFQVLLRKENSLKNDNKITPLYDFQFYVYFTRYRDNRELIKHTRKLGKHFGFSLKKVDERLFLINFDRK